MRKRGGKYANGCFRCPLSQPRRTPLPCCPLMTLGTFGADSPLPLPLDKRPAMQKPFVSDRSKAERLLHSLDLDAREIAPYLDREITVEPLATLLDVGGGLGTFSVAFCRHYPSLRATLVEHPHVLPLARRAIEKRVWRKKCRSSGRISHGDALPRGFDTVFVSNVLHAHGVDENRSLLRKLHRCLNPQGQLIVRDVFMNRQRTAHEWARVIFRPASFAHATRTLLCTSTRFSRGCAKPGSHG